jgi:Lrp/AsnC family leucine-responsive transcriptional regulator
LLDEVGCRLLELLQGNARLSFAELGRRVGLSPPAVAERLRRMEDAGLVLGYRMEVDPAKLGRPIVALVRIRCFMGKADFLKHLLPGLPGVVEGHLIAGEDGYLVRIAVSSPERLEALLLRIQPYGETTTFLVLSPLFPPRPLLPEV